MTRWLLAAAIDWAVMAGALFVAWHWPNPLLIFAAVFVIGNRQHALGVLGHDGAHYSITRTRWLNDALTQVIVAWPLGLSLSGYRAFHFAHHRTILLGGHDPEIAHRERFPARHMAPVTNGRKAALFLTDLFGATSIPEYLSLARHEIFPHASREDMLGLIAFWYAVALTAWRLNGLWLVTIWWVALGTSFWAFARLRMWREHFGIDGTNGDPVPWWGFLAHLPHNIGEHAEHHGAPARPFYRLGEIR